MTKFMIATCIAYAFGLFSSGASAQAFPSRPIRIVVPFVAGGTTDIVARIVGQKLADAFSQSVIVDNRPAAGGTMGTHLVAKANPDGYTLLLCSAGPLVVNPALNPRLPYDPIKDIAPVTLVATNPYILLVNASSPFQSVQELIKSAKARPGQLNFGTPGIATTSFLVMELFRSIAQIELTHIPYKGSAQAQADLLGGQLHLMFETIPAALPLMKAGRLRALGVATTRRFSLLPNLPTVAEGGAPGFEAGSWSAICAPGGTPRDVVATLNRQIVQAVRTPELQDRFAGMGAEVVGNTPEQFAAYLADELIKWKKVIANSAAKAE